MITFQVSAYWKETRRRTRPQLHYERYHDIIRAKVDVPLTRRQLHITITSPNLAWRTPAYQEPEYEPDRNDK